MRAVVVYESVYANTRMVAEAVAEGLGRSADVSICSVADAGADALAAADLVVVGGPTHVHGMTSALSRKLAVDAVEEKGTTVDASAHGPGLRSWFHELPKVDGAKGAAFDTRLPGSALKAGSASKAIARRLRQHGYELVAKPESFLVADGEGPLVEGELERARAWGASLAAQP
jgi:flavodoxin